MKASVPSVGSSWAAPALTEPAFSVPLASPANLGPDWVELRQSWLAASEANFNRGWARIRWDQAGLLFETVFLQRNPANHARQLNERTWELGDIAEFFLQEVAGGRYLELHVTPENQRLQLLWPPDGLARFRAGTAALEQFTVGDPNWVSSETQVEKTHWAARAYVPFRCLGLAPGAQLGGLRTAVCRYDRSHGPEILSSTARLSEPNYHRIAEWAQLQLAW